MVTVLTPQLEEICTVPSDEVESWLVARGLVGKEYRPEKVVGVRVKLEEELRRAEEGAVPLLISGSWDAEKLVLQLDRLLHEHGHVVFMPVERAGSHYHSPWGFFRHMDALVQSLPEAQVSIPAGFYGRRNVKHPRRTLPIQQAIGLRMTQPGGSDPSTWSATQTVLAARGARARARARVRRQIRKTEERLGTRITKRGDAVFSDGNDHNPWVLDDCRACGQFGLDDCEQCGGLGTTGRAVRYFKNDASPRRARMRDDGCVRCPGCHAMFATDNPARWTGRRHITCGQKIELEDVA